MQQDTWDKKVQLLGTQANYDVDGNNVQEFGIYYRLRQCTPLSTTAATDKLCSGKQIAEKFAEKAKKGFFISTNTEIKLSFSKQEMYATASYSCHVFTPKIEVIFDSTAPSATSEFIFGDPQS